MLDLASVNDVVKVGSQVTQLPENSDIKFHFNSSWQRAEWSPHGAPPKALLLLQRTADLRTYMNTSLRCPAIQGNVGRTNRASGTPQRYCALHHSKNMCQVVKSLATHAYNAAIANRHMYSNAIEVLLDVVESMPDYIGVCGGRYSVCNPEHEGENFAERWNEDDGMRARAFYKWHGQLKSDLNALFADSYSRSGEAQIRKVFGEDGVKAWKASLAPAPSGLLNSLIKSAPGGERRDPVVPVPSGSKKNTLA
ncbi:hypothetical protein VSR34_21710 [Paraburkholderia sp. JHI2823]|uniref:hypothetical protein n=1 Tax=Paraburkholderia sp. JHI2823 TaxID=3112960 RepID=UPI00316EECF7